MMEPQGFGELTMQSPRYAYSDYIFLALAAVSIVTIVKLADRSFRRYPEAKASCLKQHACQLYLK